MPNGGHVLKDDICLSYYGRRSCSDHFCKNDLSSDKWFQRRTFLSYNAKQQHSLMAMFLIFNVFCRLLIFF